MKRLLAWAKVHKIKALGILAAILVVASITVPNVRNVADTAIGHITTVSALGTADYALDGTDDNVQFQLALNALPATGGVIQCVSSGTIDWDAGVTVTRAIANVTIMGTGPGTYFDGDGVTPIFTAGGNNWNFMDFRTDAGSISFGATTGYSVKNVMVGTAYLQDRDGRGTYASASGAPDYVVGVNTATDDVPGSTGYWVKSGATGQVVYSTNNASAADLAIQYAIDTNLDVALTTGTFTVGAQINLDNDHQSLTGSGWLSILKPITDLNDDILYVSRTYITIANLAIDGNKTNQSVSGNGITFVFNGNQRSYVDHVFIHDVKTIGIKLGGVGGTNTMDNAITNSYILATPTGIYAGNYGGWLITETQVVNSTTYGIDINVADWAQVSDSRITGSSTAVASGIHIYWSQNVLISGNDIDGMGAHGIYIDGTASSNDIKILGNMITQNGKQAAATYSNVYVPVADFKAVDRVIIANNDLRDNGDEKYSIEAPTPYRAADWVVTGNIVNGCDLGVLFNPAGYYDGIIRNNQGYVTENSGTATLLNGQTTIVVPHGLSTTPVTITITFLENPTNAIADWWVDTIGAVNFTFNGVDPGASNLDFRWTATAY